MKNHSNAKMKNLLNKYKIKKKDSHKLVYDNFDIKLKMYKKRKMTKFK